MKHIKIAAGLAHVNYGRIADLVKEVSDAGVDYIHSDAADMHDLQNMKLMGGHQIIAGIRPEKSGRGRRKTSRSNVTFIQLVWTECSSNRLTRREQIC